MWGIFYSCIGVFSSTRNKNKEKLISNQGTTNSEYRIVKINDKIYTLFENRECQDYSEI